MAPTKTKKSKKRTPLMEQYFQMKAKYGSAILLFRVGDFYETFGEDAIKASSVLGITLTARNNGGSNIELAGFPYHSLDVYLPKLVKGGYRVAICEQLEKPSKEKKIVKRGVTDVVTPGVTINETILDQGSNNYLASIHYGAKNRHGLAFIDISTGEFLLTECNEAEMEKLVSSFDPSEIIYSKSYNKRHHQIFSESYYVYPLDEWIFTPDYTREKLLEKFGVANLKGFGVEDLDLGQIAAGSAIHYLESTHHTNLNHIKRVSRIQNASYVWLDRFTIRNLELVHSNHESGIPLIRILDKTVSPMGARMLKKWVLLPLISLERINARHEMVTYCIDHLEFVTQMTDAIRTMGDTERLASKVSMLKVNPRELIQLKRGLDAIEAVKDILTKSNHPQFVQSSDQLDPCDKVREHIASAILDEPPVMLNKGRVFKEGYNAELDEYLHIVKNSKELLLNIQTTEAEKTGIANLKIGFNNVFGYYLEVTNKYKNQGLIPENWVRKQTLTNAERYITDELKQLESKILGAEDRINEIEETLYRKLVLSIVDHIDALQQNAKIIANIDCICSFANVAIKNTYCRPVMSDSLDIKITAGRHPVIEQHMALDEQYVPNDISISNEDTQLLMITGPNMSGKSAILRQTALICLMAQMGSFVPADIAELGIIDKLFTRVGASDNISSGESTFMLEMNETASIMNNISERSLILLDEIGRGTSTYDGISIAWSLAEYLHNNKIANPKTLFATHYHELNELANKYPRIKNFNVATKEIDNRVIFLRKLVPGGSKHSFGIHVARMAGMPVEILGRAKEILKTLEQKSISSDGIDLTTQAQAIMPEPYQMSIFERNDPVAGKIKNALEEIQLNAMTPIECMMKLKELQDILEHE